MPFDPINPPQFPAPDAPFSAAAKAGNTVYVSGVVAVKDDGTELYPGNIRLQTKHVLERIKATLEAAGGGLADVAMNHVVIRYLGDYAAFNEVYAGYFPDARPARFCVQGAPVTPGCLVEIASVAHLGEGGGRGG